LPGTPASGNTPNVPSFDDLLAEGSAVPVAGWDFSWFGGRASEERPPWGYARMLGTRMAALAGVPGAAALDLQTGGGEVLATIPAGPPILVATESWPPNVPVARRNLASLGARVVPVASALADLPFTKDLQIMAIRNARRSLGERLARTAAPHKILDPAAGPLIAVRLNIVTRKTLGGLQTDLSGRVLTGGGSPLPGLYAAGEIAGFGGGGVHGYRSLEGTFLGGCLFSGRQAGRAAARDTAS
jgi:uncharacterized protein